MKVVVGIDIGGSTTKICGFTEDRKLIHPLCVKADDPVASIYGAFGKFTSQAKIELADIEKIMITGVGSSYIHENLFGITTEHVREFDAIGFGGQYLADLSETVVVSMGTGTAIIHVKGERIEYLGGTGVGGGTMLGLSKIILGVSDIENLEALAEKGDISKIDLRVSDITQKDYNSSLFPDTTASNFGRLSEMAQREDLALGIINLVFETVGMMSVFAAKKFHISNVVLIGNLTRLHGSKTVFEQIGKMFGMNYIIPEKSQYGTVIGAALLCFKK